MKELHKREVKELIKPTLNSVRAIFRAWSIEKFTAFVYSVFLLLKWRDFPVTMRAREDYRFTSRFPDLTVTIRCPTLEIHRPDISCYPNVSSDYMGRMNSSTADHRVAYFVISLDNQLKGLCIKEIRL